MKYTSAQWKCIQRIQNKLDEDDPTDSEADDPELTNILMCLYMLTVM